MLGTLTPAQINEVLENNITGRLGCTDGQKIYIVPINYAFNGTYLVAHSREGMKINMMRQNPHVCFEVEELDNPANWRSVIAWGDYEEVTDPKEKYYAMKFLVSHLMHVKISETAGIQEMEKELAQAQAHVTEQIRPILYRIRIKEKTGRFEKG
jgi:hypothetical protein